MNNKRGWYSADKKADVGKQLCDCSLSEFPSIVGGVDCTDFVKDFLETMCSQVHASAQCHAMCDSMACTGRPVLLQRRPECE